MARILVIDDAAVFRTLCRTVLEEAGHKVEDAPDGAEGVRRFRAAPADLVLCDLLMPIQDGCQTIRELRTFSAVPVVVMNGRTSRVPGAKCFEDALQLGANRTLQKPFISSELLGLVRDLLRPAS